MFSILKHAMRQCLEGYPKTVSPLIEYKIILGFVEQSIISTIFLLTENMENGQELKNTLGQNIKTRRNRNGWSQEELSDKADVSKNTISDIENGQKFARANTLVKLANALKTEVYELVKPESVLPDKNADIIAKYSEEVREAVEKIGNFYMGNQKN